MKKNWIFISIALISGFISAGAWNYFFAPKPVLSLLDASGTPVYSASFAGLPNEDFTAAAERTLNTVVHVKTQSEVQQVFNPWMDFFGYQQQPQVQMASGSGVIISHDGYVITNNHVVEGADKLTVTLNNNKNYEATVVGRDPSTDIAVIKIDEKNLPAAQWGSSDDVRIGQWVLAVGNPFELTSTVTAGIVSAKARNINLLSEKRNSSNEEIFPVESFIQTDAAVNPGNSGGALVNTKGELIGINTAIASRTGVYAGYSFAVPSSIAKKVAEDLIQYGNVQRAFIGVKINDVTEEQAKEKGLKEVAGVYVNSLTEGGAAAESGIKEGDIILKVGEITVKNVPQLQEQISKYHPGDKVAVTVWRDSKLQNITVTLKNRIGKAELENFTEEAKATYESLGGKFVTPSTSELSALRLQGGAKVEDLGNGKLMAAGVKRGFIITKVDSNKINSPEDLQEALKGKSGGVLIEGYYPNGMKAYYGFGL
jgi:Do/DeqQ family serine protease